MSRIQKVISRTATAQVFREIGGSESRQLDVINQFKQMPDSQLDMFGLYAGITKEHLPIYRAMVRGEKNAFVDGLNTFSDALQPGDIILVLGTAGTSKALLKAQKRVYSKARSSHVIVSQMDFICVDAVPKIGVSPRVIPDLLNDVEADWQVIRCKEVSEKHHETIMKMCAYYLEQPYLIFPSKKPAKKYSYCSELARKIYAESGLEKSGIPTNKIIKPCDFDQLADESQRWEDVTASVKPYIEFCIAHADILRFIAKTYIQGIDLNRQRFKERAETKKSTIKRMKAGEISKEEADRIISAINKTESSLNYKFWDHSQAKA
ncbi:YiiX/YebB-like N1pC/P60 family cysteine hydrolase [Vibrio vulnificus]|uniref:YiiX/YebB-like N1pC/P60 family cysteine hydrolase n=1 Tax=Vibrio vulnificus TaxID=672 RepID=UPI000318D6E8|nr:YiiX/YebB-like N1pC/P60 family cysteine hydrolase [Vibrio vulnificus]ASM97554.1 hypothetical protein AOT11_20830 [Vibrio vulnificus NBRC 15645 = ATCC 27562]EGQ9994159.1 hypothetical protein [Vibrio vulnificus]EHU9517390.1 hypothetical protein [Vibrio vulnificus]MCL7021061.1 hypothetical protein [Vibrio vulnificus]MDK2702526.1 YiiX/YebB-like N1pC/P60 family cysteine hydrolase [Vibrio vulnificus]